MGAEHAAHHHARLELDPLDEVLDDGDGHVGLEERLADLAETIIDVVRGQLAPGGQATEGTGQGLGYSCRIVRIDQEGVEKLFRGAGKLTQYK